MTLLLILWLHFFWSLVPSWIDGVYYDYGWLVAPLALAFGWRRWRAFPDSAGGSLIRPGFLIPFGAFLLILIPLRTIELGDPGWRVPIWIHTLGVLALTHEGLRRVGGMKLSRWFLPVTVFALTAVPLPWQIEQFTVRSLTDQVTGLTQELFILRGIPVERLGETLWLDGAVVEVGDACSGIRSLQSLVMAALFFGELLWLSWPRRFALLGVAAACALIFNTLRASALAQARFFHGTEALDRIHDPAGHIAFALSALILFIAARFLIPTPKRRLIRRQLGDESREGSVA